MTEKKFTLWNRICAAVAFVVSAVTYLLTIEPSASYWDCGEFIASSYKLEVGHPPGNPVFQLFARIFTLFGDNMHAAILVNAMSALCSAATILFLYLTVVWLAKRLVRPAADGYSTAQAVAIFGSGLVGGLVYTFSDTFWFSAVEGEVYAMSSLFTAVVFWLMTVWYDRADEPHSLRWIVLIAFLMGLSIGVHLLNLLAIPALVFMYYYRQREDKPFTFWELVKIFAVGVVILGVIVFIVVPYLPKLAAYFDLFFVNTLGLPYNSGAAFFLVALLAALFWGLFRTLKTEKVFLNTVLLCATTIVIGFSVFSIDIIRSSAKTPTNEYQPDNAFTLVRYLSREQYGSTPLLYGQYYGAPYELKTTTYWAPMDGKYKKVEGPIDAKYKASGKMLFPRMWSTSADGSYEAFYETYTNGNQVSYVSGTYTVIDGQPYLYNPATTVSGQKFLLDFAYADHTQAEMQEGVQYNMFVVWKQHEEWEDDTEPTNAPAKGVKGLQQRIKGHSQRAMKAAKSVARRMPTNAADYYTNYTICPISIEMPNGVNSLNATTATTGIYTVGGLRTNRMHKGVNIIVSGGKAHKVVF